MDELFGKDPDAAGVVIDASGLPDAEAVHACRPDAGADAQYRAIVLPELKNYLRATVRTYVKERVEIQIGSLARQPRAGLHAHRSAITNL